ncbi:MAG TPA: hypothetical protein VEI02_16700 [Planctomycetota bacterium]|nr:hypothetical protein [Planctomycetota bacterium]
MNRFDRSRGSALATALLSLIVLFGLSSSYLVLSYGGFQSAEVELATARARLAAEEGVHRSIAELRADVDADKDGLGSLQFVGDDGRSVRVTATDLGGGLYGLRSTGALPRARAALEVVVERSDPDGLPFPPRAAITANGPVSITGNITIDGRDWNEFGTAIVGPGAYGVSTTKTLSNSGNAKVGGYGVAPAKPPPAATKEVNATWKDGIDQDLDGVVDEEVFDGKDNDGDGNVDEDTMGYPSTPDVMFGLGVDSLKNYAKAQGTYFKTELEWTLYMTLNGGKLPGGKVYYCDFNTWMAPNFNSALNAAPSVLVHHNSTGTAQMKNVHGTFKGLMLLDFVQHLNGDFLLVGALMSFGDSQYGNAFGNGAAQVKLSSEVLSNLPSIGGTHVVRVRSWRRAAAES